MRDPLKVKTPQPDLLKVYKVPCLDCDGAYMEKLAEETNRTQVCSETGKHDEQHSGAFEGTQT